MKLFNLLETQYNQFETAVKNYLSKTLSNYNVSYGNNTVFGQLINVLGAVVQNIILYIEDSLVEQNKYTAQRKKSIYGLAALTGYNPSLGKSAGVQLKINFVPNNTDNLNIIINNKTTLTCTQNGLNYNMILPQDSIVMSLTNENGPRFIYAVQGNFESQTFISTGGQYYTQNFKFLGNLDTDYLEVRINNELWEQVASIYDMNPDGKQYCVKTSPISGLDVVFGNDQFGRALKADDVIKITYLLHDGELGNLDVESETYFVFNNPLYNTSGESIDGNNIFNVSFATHDAVTSGTNSENIEQVRQMIGLNSRSLVLTSPDHYKNFLSKFSFCGYNRTWTEKGSLIVNSLIMKNYKQLLKNNGDYFTLKEKDFKLSKTQKASILNCLENSGQQLAGVSYNIFDPVICKYAIYLYIKMKPTTYDKEFINNKIRNLIGEFFSNIKSDIFISKSEIIKLLTNNIPEIGGMDIYILSERNETALQKKQYTDTQYIYNTELGIYKKKTETVYLFGNENPNLGLDEHGNIYLQSDEQFPVLMGGWDFLNSEGQEVTVNDPLIIIYE